MKEKIVMKNVFYDRPQGQAQEPKRPVFATIEHEDEAIILSNLLDDVYVHDYSYAMSDDARVYERGKRNEDRIKKGIDILVFHLKNDPIVLLKQLLECRAEQFIDGLTHRVIKSWFAIYM
jgi:hypothetical protein